MLKSLDLDFEVKTREVDETYPSDIAPLDVAEYLARKKSDAFGELQEDALLITSDTTVVVDSTILGKAEDREEAISMIQSLSGRTHKVASGVCLRTREKFLSFTEITKVTFDVLSAESISYYIEKYQPYDKAGAYGIQEWIGMIGINKIEGDYYNVMGLPVNRLYKELSNFK
ncbi:Maf family nucleotide pyrophosphatase [Roseivirga sp. 4D4]|uniref:Maf family nucleotide pyrophosphatase n=1 Tax=Roseivirga sp. 4D4 TaxID=1889784 RepID=UPI000AC84E8A|nr:Maf family nucleotide pyrophosphatase [Roseivirga sp. 4D4]